MRKFIWDCFSLTGSIELYLLYREIDHHCKMVDEYQLEEEAKETCNIKLDLVTPSTPMTLSP